MNALQTMAKQTFLFVPLGFLQSERNNRSFPVKHCLRLRLHSLSTLSIVVSNSLTRTVLVRYSLERLVSSRPTSLHSKSKDGPFAKFDELRQSICHQFSLFSVTTRARCGKKILSFAHFVGYFMLDSAPNDVHRYLSVELDGVRVSAYRSSCPV